MTAPTLTPQDVEEGRRLIRETLTNIAGAHLRGDLIKKYELAAAVFDATIAAAERLPRLEAQLERINALAVTVESQRLKFDELEARANMVVAEKAILTAQLALLREELDNAALVIKLAHDENQRLRAQLAASAQEVTLAIGDRDTMRRELAAAEAEVERLKAILRDVIRDSEDRSVPGRVKLVNITLDTYNAIRAALTAAPTPTTTKEELGWLIERTSNGATLFWMGKPEGEYRAWTSQAHQALRLARKIDAVTLLHAYLNDEGDVVEHLWSAPTPSEGEQ